MNSLFRPIPRLLTLLAALALLFPAARARDHDRENDESKGSTARVKFSDPTKPGTLNVSLPWADARITATDGKEVIVTSTLDQKGHKEVDSEGFRRIDEDATFELVEKDNVATIVIAGENMWAAHGAEFDIKVPRNTNLKVVTQAGGDVEVEGVEGDLDIHSMNGDIELRDIASSAVANTMNGEIKASFKRAPTKPVSLSSMNGEIDLHLPADTKASVRMQTHHGSIRTNFPEGVLQAKTEKTNRSNADNSPNPPNAPADVRGEVSREMARETARMDREQAKIAREVAKATAEAARIAASVATSVTTSVNGDTVVVNIPPMPPMPPMPHFGGKSIVGTLNGGGVDIILTSMNGTITLRETK
jgi:hypothetical protein